MREKGALPPGCTVKKVVDFWLQVGAWPMATHSLCRFALWS